MIRTVFRKFGVEIKIAYFTALFSGFYQISQNRLFGECALFFWRRPQFCLKSSERNYCYKFKKFKSFALLCKTNRKNCLRFQKYHLMISSRISSMKMFLFLRPDEFSLQSHWKGILSIFRIPLILSNGILTKMDRILHENNSPKNSNDSFSGIFY